MKICDTCKETKDLSEFNKNKSKKDGLNSICRVCSNARSKLYYAQKGAEHVANVVQRNKKHKESLRAKMLDYLSTNHCVDCGNSDVRVLEFDHLPEFEKSRDISLMMAHNSSWSNIQKEIEKCEVICANCHRIRTCERSGNYKAKRI